MFNECNLGNPGDYDALKILEVCFAVFKVVLTSATVMHMIMLRHSQRMTREDKERHE